MSQNNKIQRFKNLGIVCRPRLLKKDGARTQRCRTLGCKFKTSEEFPDGFMKFYCDECKNIQSCHRDDKELAGWLLRRSLIQPYMEQLWYMAYPEQEKLLQGFVKDENYEDFSFT